MHSTDYKKLSRLVFCNFFGERKLQNKLYIITDNNYIYIKLGFNVLCNILIDFCYD